MARTTNKVSEKEIGRLKKNIVHVFGDKIVYPVDCIRLSDAIFSKTKLYLSPSTLKRFMGFYESGFKPSYQTLDILALYCGYDGWNNFNQQKQSIPPISQEELQFFRKIFSIKDYNDITDHDETMQMVSRRIAERLREDPKAFECIVPELAKNKLAQTFYFEHFPDYDNLVAYQYKGYNEYLKHKKTGEAQIFGNCLHFFRAFLLQDSSLMKHYNEVLLNIEIPKDIHPMPLGRYYQCLILNAHFAQKTSPDKIIKHVFSIEKRIPRIGFHFKNFPGFHYFIADALVLTGKYNEAIKLIDLATKNYTIEREFVWKGYYRQLQLMLAEAFFHLNKKARAAELLKKINPENFYFISQKYFTIRFLILSYKIGGKNRITKKEINELIEKHQFLALKELIK